MYHYLSHDHRLLQIFGGKFLDFVINIFVLKNSFLLSIPFYSVCLHLCQSILICILNQPTDTGHDGSEKEAA